MTKVRVLHRFAKVSPGVVVPRVLEAAHNIMLTPIVLQRFRPCSRTRRSLLPQRGCRIKPRCAPGRPEYGEQARGQQ
jgi:hypothetical protein